MWENFLNYGNILSGFKVSDLSTVVPRFCTICIIVGLVLGVSWFGVFWFVCLFFKETHSTLMPRNLLKILHLNVPMAQHNAMQNYHSSVWG